MWISLFDILEMHENLTGSFLKLINKLILKKIESNVVFFYYKSLNIKF